MLHEPSLGSSIFAPCELIPWKILTKNFSLWKGERIILGESVWGECWGQNPKREAKLGSRRGRDFGRVSLFSFLMMEWDPKTYFYMQKDGYLIWGWDKMGKMVIWFRDGIQWDQFLATFGGK
jgi:hypothetical protein